MTNPGGLESVLERPFTSLGGVALFPDLVSKVAALIHSIIAFHPFADGGSWREGDRRNCRMVEESYGAVGQVKRVANVTASTGFL